MSANAASKSRKQLDKATSMWMPNMDAYTEDYFDDLIAYAPEADKVADQVSADDTDRALAMQERAMPGITKGRQGAFDALMPLLRGELPPAVLEAFMRSGAASSVGAGFGGSGYGFVNQGLFGARGALGAMQTGYGLLPALMSTLPQVNSPSTASFLQAIMTPAQKTQAQLQARGQNMGNAATVAAMPTSSSVWGSTMQQVGGAMVGGGIGGMGGGMNLGTPQGATAGASTGVGMGSPNYVTPL